jgi:dsDNA-specific endonuclease/ATPase MutS2
MYSQRNSEQALRGTTNLENQSSGLRNEFQTLKDKVESFEKDRKKWQDYESQQNALRNKIKELEQMWFPDDVGSAEADSSTP